MVKRVRAYVGLGANVGDPQANLEHAVAALAGLPGVRIRAVSPLYRTKPVGPLDQPDFLNAVAAIDVPGGPDPQTGALALLGALKAVEHALGRQERRRWGPREIDLDLLVFGRHRISLPTLEVPHSRMASRQFVLAPLADLGPRLTPPGWKQSVATALRRLRAREAVNAIECVGEWDEVAQRWLMALI